jgi:hypothetical protein
MKNLKTSTISQIREQIAKAPAGKPFVGSSLRHLAPTDNLRKILERLAKSGEIKRVARGVFIKPKQVAYLGEYLPSTREVVEVLAHASGEIISIHGAEAARQLRLTTQVPMQTVFYTTGNSRKIKIGKRVVTLKHISPKKLIMPGTIVGTVITALWYLGRKNVSSKTLEIIHQQLTQKDFNTVLQQIPYMPAWMASVFFHFQQSKRISNE